MNKIFGLFSARRLFECRSVSTRLTADGKVIPKKKTFENRITLIGTDNSVSITEFKNAESLSTRRELKLVKIQDVDSKTRRPIYKLMTNSDYHHEELEKRKEKQEARQKKIIKGQKLFSLSSKIEDHDLAVQVKKMIKLLEKQYEVKIVIVSDGAGGEQKSESLCSFIEKTVKSHGNLVQKRQKGNTLKFQLLPKRDSSTQSESADSDNNDSNKGPL